MSILDNGGEHNPHQGVQVFIGLPAVPVYYTLPRDLRIGLIADVGSDWGPGVSGGPVPLGIGRDDIFGTPDIGAAILFDTRWSTVLINCPEPGGAIEFDTGIAPDTGLPDFRFAYFHIHHSRASLISYDGIRLLSSADQAGTFSLPNWQGSGGVIDFGENTASGNATREEVETGYCRLFAEDNGAGKTRLRVKWDDQTFSTLATQP
jgi:hypothetical protein